MNLYEKAQRKAKVLSVLVIAFFLLWTATLFFSETMLYITLGLGFLYFVAQAIWLIYQIVKDEMTALVWEKESKRRGFK